MSATQAVHPSLRRQADAQAARIRALFDDGHSIDYVAERGVHEGWTRARVFHLVAAHGWVLDPAGHLIGRRPTGNPAQQLAQLDRDAARLRGALAVIAEQRAAILAAARPTRSKVPA